ncbi:MAG: hypothetical protein ABEI96_04480 [Haloarculaceae archaeon]
MVYRCSQCGDLYDDDDPPCDNCGNEYFEEVTEVVESTGDQVWVCTECGRVHVKYSPPCSRCGNYELEKRSQDYDLADTAAPSYVDLASPAYLLAAAGLLVVLALLALVLTGVVPLPAFLGGTPSVSNVPGEATTANGVSLGDAEAVVVAQLNDRRASAGAANLTRTDGLDEMATYYNRKRVKATYDGGDPPDARGLARRFDYSCRRSVVGAVVPTGDGGPSIDDVDSARELGRSLATTFGASDAVTDSNRREVGVDVHVAPDGTVYATMLVC